MAVAAIGSRKANSGTPVSVVRTLPATACAISTSEIKLIPMP